MSETILEMRGVTKRFPGVLALSKVDITVNKGEILAICGENGAGKSTLMKVLNGTYVAGTYEGDIYVDGKHVRFHSIEDAQKSGIEMISQELSVLLDATLAENIFIGNLPGKNGVVDFKTLYAETEKALKTIKLDASPKMMGRRLNSGQLQMISIMRAFVKKPKLLVLDEPTSALTDKETEILMSLLRDFRSQGGSCIYISHKLDEVFQISDRIMVMRDGEMINSHKVDKVSMDQLVAEMVGREITDFYPKVDFEIGEETLRVENLTIPHPSIPGKNIIEDVSFSLHRGEILGIGGLVGAGRSESLEAIFGLRNKGVTKKIFVNGKETRIRNTQDAIRAGMGFLTEERKTNGIIWMFDILSNMTLAVLRDIPGKYVIDKKHEKKIAQEMFERVGVKAPSLKTLVVNLSGGNQQKVILGKWLLKSPKILFLDEPTRGIDVGAKAEVYKIMGQLVEQGVSIIMVSSDMPELLAMSDRCIVFSNGHITGEFIGDQITDENIMKAAIA